MFYCNCASDDCRQHGCVLNRPRPQAQSIQLTDEDLRAMIRQEIVKVLVDTEPRSSTILAQRAA